MKLLCLNVLTLSSFLVWSTALQCGPQPFWPQKEWFIHLLALQVEEPLKPLPLEPAGAVPHERVSQGARVAAPTCLKAIKQLIFKTNFSKEVVKVDTTATTCL